VGYWRFEPRPGALLDSGPAGRHLVMPVLKGASPRLVPAAQRSGGSDHLPPPANSSEKSALAAFCQALLNASEFLYTE
jgi:hypothetical protein